MHFNKPLLLALLLSLAFWSCRKTPSKDEIKKQNRQKLDILLKSGRQPSAILSSESTPSLSLTSGPVVRQYQAPGSEEITRILYNTSLMESIKHDNLETYALNFLSQLEGILHVTAAELSPAEVFTTQAKSSLLTLNYDRSFEGIPVKNARVTFVFSVVATGEYKLREISNKSYGRISLANAGTPLPSDADLELHTGISGLEVQSSSLAIHPSQTPKGLEFYLAKQWRVKESESGELVNVTIAAGSNEILEAFTNRFFIEHKFTAVSYEENYLEPAKSPGPLAFIPITNNVLTDGNGVADIPAGTNTNQLSLEGDRYKIIDGTNLNVNNIDNLNINNLRPISLTGTTVGAETTFRGNTPVEDQSLTTLRGIQKVQQLARKHLTPEQTPLFGRSIATFVNAPESCNAFYYGDRLQNSHLMVFYSEGNAGNTTCASTGLLADVVAHEWCHALDDFTGPVANNSGVTDPSFSEGIGDICSAYLSGTPGLGAGFFLNNPNALRTVENERSFPGDFEPLFLQNGNPNPNFSPHSNGLIIGGAFWHMRVGLIEKYGPEKGAYLAEELFFKHLLDTPDFLSSYDTLLTLDDDDGNPATQSPNHCIINEAFARHGLAEEEPNCSDDPVLPKGIPANFELFFGVEQDANGIDKWVGSAAVSEEVAQIEVCIGGPDLCLSPAAVTIKVPHSGQQGGRDYFKSVVPALLEPYTEITLIATHYYGNKSYRNYITSPK